MRIGKALEQERIHQREDGRVRADGKRQSKDHRKTEAGVLAELAGTEAEIRKPGMQGIAKPLLADLLFHLFGAAEFDAGGALRFLGRHASAKIFVNQKLEVRANLLVEVLLHTASLEEIEQETSGFCEDWHATPLPGYNGLRRFQGLSDGPGNSAPALRSGFELLPTGSGQAIVFRAAIIFGVSPERVGPAFFFHAMQRRKEGARLDHKSSAGDLLDSA